MVQLEKRPTFTVIIPTFNRGPLLDRALRSIQEQTFRSFEVIVVDDGSNDDTQERLKSWSSPLGKRLRIVFKENGGKHTAHNEALPLIRGKYTMILDSDDELLTDALHRFNGFWEEIENSGRTDIAGVEGHFLRADTEDIEGTEFPEDYWITDYISQRCVSRIGGDKIGTYRSDLIKTHPFPVFSDEKHIRPSLLWKQLALSHKLICINEAFARKNYTATGLSSDRDGLRYRNPQGFRYYFREDLERFQPTFRGRIAASISFCRYAFHCGESWISQVRNSKKPALVLWGLIPGFVKYRRDLRRARRFGWNR